MDIFQLAEEMCVDQRRCTDRPNPVATQHATFWSNNIRNFVQYFVPLVSLFLCALLLIAVGLLCIVLLSYVYLCYFISFVLLCVCVLLSYIL